MGHDTPECDGVRDALPIHLLGDEPLECRLQMLADDALCVLMLRL